VTDQEFFFSIELSGQTASHDMLRELVSRILGQAGCALDGGPAVADALHAAVVRSAAQGDPSCTLTFLAGGDRLEIVVSSSSGHLWQTTHPMA
jgi:hypothetical protein